MKAADTMVRQRPACLRLCLFSVLALCFAACSSGQGTPVEQGNRVFLTDEEYAAKTERLAGLRARYEDEDSSDTMGMGHWAEMGESNRRTSFLVLPENGRLPPKTEQGQQNADAMRSSWRAGQRFQSPLDFDSWDRCITRGLPTSMFPGMYNNGIRIFQAPGLVAMQLEMIHETRIIYTDGRPPIPSQIGHWMGESRGHWEDANTLVIETTNFRPGPSATSNRRRGSPWKQRRGCMTCSSSSEIPKPVAQTR